MARRGRRLVRDGSVHGIVEFFGCATCLDSRQRASWKHRVAGRMDFELLWLLLVLLRSTDWSGIWGHPVERKAKLKLTGPIFDCYPLEYLIIPGVLGIVASTVFTSLSKGKIPNRVTYPSRGHFQR